jgi:hypothetical protein
MTREETIKRLCQLSSKVAHHQGYTYAADCFCCDRERKGWHDEDFRSDGKALEFIEQVVVAAIKEQKASLRELAPDIKQAINYVRESLDSVEAKLGWATAEEGEDA